jgi:hypothetical protein
MMGRRSRSLGLGLAEREGIAALLSLDPSRPFADVEDAALTGDGRNMGLGELVFTRRLLKPTSVGLMGDAEDGDLAVRWGELTIGVHWAAHTASSLAI